jgi:hypothetical protein
MQITTVGHSDTGERIIRLVRSMSARMQEYRKTISTSFSIRDPVRTEENFHKVPLFNYCLHAQGQFWSFLQSLRSSSGTAT